MQKQGRGLNTLLCAALLVLSLCGCADETVEPPPAMPKLPRAPKGYELYSWKSGGTWLFTLITGTNRLKTLGEVTSPENMEEGDWVKITAAGVPELKSVLARLPAGTPISWVSARHLDTDPQKPEPSLRQPPKRVVREVQTYCAELGLDLNAGR